jgi:hypothetical protein
VQFKIFQTDWRRWLPICSLLFIVSCDSGQEQKGSKTNSQPKMTGKQRHEWLVFTTPAYRQEALRLMLEEVNRVAQELNLPEKLPITKADLIDLYITPPHMSKGSGTIGVLATRNYRYYMSCGRKFSAVHRTPDENYDQLKAQYLWPMSQMDTNAAYQLATQFLAAVSMDVKALNRDCNLHVHAFVPEGKYGMHFVPVYWVSWVKGDVGHGSEVQVEVLMPTKSLRALDAWNSEYILRKPLEITNLDFLLSQTNTPANTNAPRQP